MDKNYGDWKLKQRMLGNLWDSKAHRNPGELVGPWKRKFSCKRKDANRRGHTFLLTLEEYLYKAYEAGLTCPSQISTKGDSSKNFNLARFKDKGNYTVDNCRFITHKENIRERNEHFSISKVMKDRVEKGIHNFSGGEIQRKRVQNGTHNFLGGKIQRESNKKRVQEGTHNFLTINKN